MKTQRKNRWFALAMSMMLMGTAAASIAASSDQWNRNGSQNTDSNSRTQTYDAHQRSDVQGKADTKRRDAYGKSRRDAQRRADNERSNRRDAQRRADNARSNRWDAQNHADNANNNRWDAQNRADNERSNRRDAQRRTDNARSNRWDAQNRADNARSNRWDAQNHADNANNNRWDAQNRAADEKYRTRQEAFRNEQNRQDARDQASANSEARFRTEQRNMLRDMALGQGNYQGTLDAQTRDRLREMRRQERFNAALESQIAAGRPLPPGLSNQVYFLPQNVSNSLGYPSNYQVGAYGNDYFLYNNSTGTVADIIRNLYNNGVGNSTTGTGGLGGFFHNLMGN